MAVQSWTRRYPKTGLARYFINAYNIHKEWEGTPKTVCLYNIWQNYGGPEEGGWWYEAGEPLQHHFIFNKKQAIRRCLELAEEFQLESQEAIDDSRGLTAYDIKFRDGYGEFYPAERPYYC